MRNLSIVAMIVCLAAAGCSPQPTPDLAATVLVAVESTRAAEPTTTQVVAPTPTPLPTYTPIPTYTPLPTYTPRPSPTPYPTATLTPTPEPTATPTLPPAPAPASDAPSGPRPGSSAALLDSMRTVKGWIEEYGGWIDRGVRGEGIDCQELVRLFDSAIAAPVYTMPANDAVLLWANDRYREAIALFDDGARNLAGHCREWMAGNSRHGYANSLELTRARSAANDAGELLHVAIAKLEEEGY